jgi:predicted transposase YbfD/YdcC
MKCTMLPMETQLPDEPFAFSLQALVDKLHTVKDLRDPRGVRYPLPVVLTVAVLAKLAGHSQLRSVAEWAGLRSQQLCPLLGFSRTTLPHPTTWSRIFSTALDPCALDQAVGELFKELCQPLTRNKRRRRGGLVLTIDGKTLRGTIPFGHTQGVHLMCAYLPQVGVVLAQLEVDQKGNELTVAPTLLAQLDLGGVVVTGDAMFTQRNLSAQIVKGRGDYLWKVKENQPELLADIRALFEPPPPTKSEAPNFALPPDLEWASSLNKGHGRLEERTIWVSSALRGYSDWPHLQQVFKLKCQVVDALGHPKETVHYGVTSLPRTAASPQRLLQVVRGHWGIENGLHYRRDVSLDEDYSQVRMGHAPHVLATLNNVVVGLAAYHKQANLPAAQRAFHYRLERILWSQRPLRPQHHQPQLLPVHLPQPLRLAV